jgi:hypothetical protein
VQGENVRNIFLSSILFLGQSFTCMAITAPGPEVVDQYVQIALSMDVKAPTEQDQFTCKMPLNDDFSGIGFGQSMEEAQQYLQLLCIKDRCEHMGEQVSSEMIKLQNLSEKDFGDFAEFAGLTPEQIEALLSYIKNRPPITQTTNTCLNSASFRTVAFDLCFSQPLSCQKN